MKNAKLLITLIAFSVACNKGTDPKKEYSEVKSVPGKAVASETLDVAMGPLSINMVTTSDLGYATFVAGETGRQIEFEIKPHKDSPVKEWEASAPVKPSGSDLVRKGDSNIWVFKWNPDINETESRAKLRIRAVVKDSADTRQNGIASVAEFIINIDKQPNLPQIKGITGLKSSNGQIPTLTLGGPTQEFTVEVEDKLSSTQNPPNLVDIGCDTGNNKESPKEAAANFTRRVSSTGVPGTHKFLYKFEIDPDERFVREATSHEGFELCYRFQVFAGNNNTRVSEIRPQNVRILTEPKKPEVIMPTGTRTALLGKTFDFTIDVVVPGNEIGKLVVTTTELTPENFPGRVKLEDNTANSRHARRKNAFSKTFTWNVASNPEALGREYTLRVEAKHIVSRNGKELPAQPTVSEVKFKVIDETVVGAARATTTRRAATPPTTPPAGGQ